MSESKLRELSMGFSVDIIAMRTYYITHRKIVMEQFVTPQAKS